MEHRLPGRLRRQDTRMTPAGAAIDVAETDAPFYK